MEEFDRELATLNEEVNDSNDERSEEEREKEDANFYNAVALFKERPWMLEIM